MLYVKSFQRDMRNMFVGWVSILMNLPDDPAQQVCNGSSFDPDTEEPPCTEDCPEPAGGTCEGHASWSGELKVWAVYERGTGGGLTISPTGAHDPVRCSENILGLCLPYVNPAEITDDTSLLVDTMAACEALTTQEVRSLGFAQYPDIGTGYSVGAPRQSSSRQLHQNPRPVRSPMNLHLGTVTTFHAYLDEDAPVNGECVLRGRKLYFEKAEESYLVWDLSQEDWSLIDHPFAGRTSEDGFAALKALHIDIHRRPPLGEISLEN